MKDLYLTIDPVAKPRMTRSDSWKKRPAVVRYWQFKDDLIAAVDKRKLPHPIHVIFILPMPNSWSKKKKAEMLGQYHTAKPDTDNLLKAFQDSLYKDDSFIADIRGTKIWGWQGQIIVRSMPTFDGTLLDIPKQ